MIDRLVTILGAGPAWLYSWLTIVSGRPDDDRAVTQAVLIEQLVPRAGLPIALAAVLGFLTDFGSSVKLGLYAALAQVLVVLALAGFVELLPAISAALRNEPTSGEAAEEHEVGKALVLISIYSLVTYLVLGEAAALWALGSGQSSTFLLVLCCASGLLMLQALTSAHLNRYRPELRRRYALAEGRRGGGATKG